MRHAKRTRGRKIGAHSESGFTLIEILIVIGLIAVLSGIVLVAINPSRQFAQARNTERASDVQTILNALGQNMADNKGILKCLDASEISSTTPRRIGTDGVDLAGCLVPDYIAALPKDPGGTGLTEGDENDTRYTVAYDANGRLIVAAPNTELKKEGDADISVTR